MILTIIDNVSSITNTHTHSYTLVMGFSPIIVLYEKVGLPSLAIPREQHCLLFIYKAFSGKLPPYLPSLLNFRRLRFHTRPQLHIRLDTPRVNTVTEKRAFSFYAPDKWNSLQDSAKLNQLISIEMFKMLSDSAFHRNCTCFFWSCDTFIIFHIVYMFLFLFFSLCLFLFTCCNFFPRAVSFVML